MRRLTFFVPGLPQPAGSKSAFAIKRGGAYTGQVAVSDANKKAKPWQRTVADAAKSTIADELAGYYDPRSMFLGPVSFSAVFFMPRPKYHYGSGKRAAILKPDAPKFHTVKPDALKLTRAIEDALTGVVWRDDSQICDERISKRYTDSEVGCFIEVKEAVE